MFLEQQKRNNEIMANVFAKKRALHQRMGIVKVFGNRDHCASILLHRETFSLTYGRKNLK